MRTQLAIERAGLVTLHLQPARRSSIPTAQIHSHRPPTILWEFRQAQLLQRRIRRHPLHRGGPGSDAPRSSAPVVLEREVKTLFPWCGIGLNAQFAKSPDIVMESFHSSYERGCQAKRSPLPIRSLVPTLDISIQACTKLAAIQRGAVRCGLFRHYLRQQYDVIDSGLLRHTRVGCGHRTRYAQRGQPRPRSGRRKSKVTN
jgi:hypothetical protein